jgi:hypothetical protein
VESYNPESDSWSAVAEMSARRSGAGKNTDKNSIVRVSMHLLHYLSITKLPNTAVLA